MNLINGNIRNMREELEKKGTPKDTDEIREGYDLSTMVANITYMPTNETQNPHKHFLVKEGIHVLDGEVEVYHKEMWEPVKVRQVAEFNLNEYHNVRTTKIKEPVTYPGAGSTIAAVTMAYKWIPPFIDIDEEDIGLVLKHDWFHEKYKNNPNDPTTSPVLRADEEVKEKFWEIVERNKEKLAL